MKHERLFSSLLLIGMFMGAWFVRICQYDYWTDWVQRWWHVGW